MVLSAFKPSNVDLITIHRSFVGRLSFELNNQAVEVIDCSIGYDAVAEGGCSIHRSTVPPKSYITTDLRGKTKGMFDSDNNVGLMFIS